MIYVLGGEYKQSLRWSNEAALDDRTCIVHNVEQLRGADRDSDIYLIGTWYKRDDIDALMDEIECRGMRKRYPVNEEGF